ncbi:MAG: hypothetical protein JXA69_07575 [Phycisphaerae bacterium]|nr:hypothetical protein [Phycisphaerae bacterium]
METRRTEATAELIDVNAVAAMLGCSARHIWRLAEAGPDGYSRMPPPVSLGVLKRWRRTELLEWLAQRCLPVRRAAK